MRREASERSGERQAKALLTTGAERVQARLGPEERGVAEEKKHSDDNVADACELSIGEAPKHAGIQANELHEKARNAAEQQVNAEKFSDVALVIQPASAKTPENPKNYDGSEKFVNWRGMDALGCGNNAVGEAHAPGQRSGRAVIAVTGDEAADASEPVAKRSGGRGDIQHLKNRNAVVAGNQDEGDCSSDGRAGKGESHGAEQLRPGDSRKTPWEFREDCGRCVNRRRPREAGDADDDVGIGGEFAAKKILLHYKKPGP